MRLSLIWVGKTKDERMRALVDDYRTRLARFSRVDVVEVRESANTESHAGVEEEGKRIIGALRDDAFVMLLDVEGQAWSSTEVAAQIERWQLEGTKDVAFVIGGYGRFGRSEAARHAPLVAVAFDFDARDGARSARRTIIQSAHDLARVALSQVKDGQAGFFLEV